MKSILVSVNIVNFVQILSADISITYYIRHFSLVRYMYTRGLISPESVPLITRPHWHIPVFLPAPRVIHNCVYMLTALITHTQLYPACFFKLRVIELNLKRYF